MITTKQLDDHTLWLKTRFTDDIQGKRLVAIDANLTAADLTDANLTRANLTDANLTRADLTAANLTRADLTAANLTRADLTTIESDIVQVLSENPQEVAGLLKALQEGRINGSSYEGKCACLVGTIANIKEIDYQQIPHDSSRPAEVWFLNIRQGHTPENSVTAKITQDWIIKWMSANLEKAIDE
jgi:uncharacterized protein YjbI with pentapeptide repeats